MEDIHFFLILIFYDSEIPNRLHWQKNSLDPYNANASQYLPDGLSSWMLLGCERRKFHYDGHIATLKRFHLHLKVVIRLING